MSSKNFYGLTGDVTIDGGILNVGNAQLYANTETSNVGIGTTNPGFALDVHGTANVGVLHSTFLYGDGSNIENIVSSQWEGSPGDPIYYASNIGISNTAPVTKTLQVGSNLYVEDAGSDVLYVTGNVTATRFIGDGSLLTGIAASLDDIVDQGNVVSNTIIIESGIDPVSNIGLVTREGVSISVSNSNPSGAFQFGVGSNLLVNVYSSNVLTVDGNIFAQKMTLGTVTVLPAYNLEQITGQGAVSVQTMSLTNATTGLTTTANIVVGGNVTATSVIITSNIEVGGNVNANTVITTANINIGRDLSVTGNVYIDNMRVADVASNLVTYDSTTGELMDSGGLISNKLAIVSEQPPSALDGASTTVPNHGVYTIEASSIATGSQLTYLFDKIIGESNKWTSAASTYTDQGVYNSGATLAGIGGEWAKITMPYKTILRHIKFESTNSSIKDISIVGLKDDMTWQLLKTVNGLNAVTSTIVVDASTYHKTYGIIIRATNSGKSQAEIGDLRLFTESLSVDGGAVTMPASVTLGNLATTGNVVVNTDTLFVDTSTNSVGIGTATPSANLHVTGNVTIGSTLMVSGFRITAQAAAVDDLEAITTSGASPVRPANKTTKFIHITNATKSTTPYTGALQVGTIGTGGEGGLGVAGNVHVGGGVYVASNLAVNTHDLFVDTTTSRVGIGKTNPATPLDVVGTVTATAFVGPLTGDVEGAVTGNATTATALAASVNIGGVAFDGSAAITPTTFDGATFNGDVAFDTNTLFVDTSANSVGVGTATPSANLHVVGNVYVSSNLTVNGNILYTKPTSVLVDSNVVAEYTGPHGRGAAVLKKYPEIIFEEGKFDANDSTRTYVQAGYTVTASSVLSSVYTPWRIFDDYLSGNDGWATLLRYNASSPGEAQSGLGATQFPAASGRYGEYIDLQLPHGIKVTNFIIKVRPTQSGSGTWMPEDSPGAGYLYGRNNGTTWTEIKAFSGLTYGGMSTNGGTQETVQVDSTVAYKYLRLQATHRAGQNGSDQYLAIGALEYYGYEELATQGDTSIDTTLKSVMNTPQTTGANVYVDGNLGATFTNQVTGPTPVGTSAPHDTTGKYWELTGELTSNITVEASTFLEGDQPHAVSVWFNSSNLEANVSNTCVFSISDQEKLDSVNLDLQSNTWHNLTYAYQGEGGSRVTYLDGRKVAEDQAEDTFGDYPPFAMTGYSQGGYVVSVSSEGYGALGWRAFNHLNAGLADYFASTTSNSGNYTAGGGSYSGSANLGSDSGGTAFVDADKGEWLVLEQPHRLKLDMIYIEARQQHESKAPEDFKIYGSNDNKNWNILLTVIGASPGSVPAYGGTGQYYPGADSGTTVRSSNYTPYKYFAIVVTKTVNANPDAMMIAKLEFYGHRENDLVRLPDPTNVLKYPHVVMTGYAQRGYVVTARTEYDTAGSNAVKAFDDNTGTAYRPVNSAYDGSGNLDSGGTFATSGSTTTPGEWIKLELPHKLVVSSLFIQSVNTGTGPSDFKLFGSNDDINWGELLSITGQTTATTGTTNAVNATDGYKYLAVVVTKTLSSQDLQIGGINFYGTGVDSIPIQIGGGNIDKVANFRVYDKFVGEDQALEIWDAQKDHFGRAKSSMTLYKGRLGLGTTEPEGRLAVLDEPHNLEEFPPRAMTGYKNHFEGHGEFCASASGTNSTYYSYKAFNGASANGQGWMSANLRYDDVTGVTNSTSTVFGGKIGEWLNIDLPYKIHLKRTTIIQRKDSAHSRPASSFTIWGSNDKVNWDELITDTSTLAVPSDPTGNPINRIINTSKLYSSYRYQVHGVIPTTGSDAACHVAEWKLFGTREQGQSVLHDGQLTLTKNLTVPRIGPPLDADDTPRRDRLVVEYNTSTNPTFEGAVRDTSGRGNDGMFYGGASYDASQKALGFDAVTGTALESGILPLQGDAVHSFSLWFNRHTNGNTVLVSIATSPDASPSNGTLNGLYVTADGGGSIYSMGNDVAIPANTFSDGSWFHVVCIYKGGGVTVTTRELYVNSVKITFSGSSGAVAGDPLNFTNPTVALGAEHNGRSNYYYDGSISQFKLYDTALTAEEVKTLYDMGRCDEGHHVVNFSKTRVGIGLGDGEAPRAALDVRGDTFSKLYKGGRTTFLTWDYLGQRSTNFAASGGTGGSVTQVNVLDHTFDIPSCYHDLGTANLKAYVKIDWRGESQTSWNFGFRIEVTYNGNQLVNSSSSDNSSTSGNKINGIPCISYDASNFDSTPTASSVTSMFSLPNCDVSLGSELKVQLVGKSGESTAQVLWTGRTKGFSTTSPAHELPISSFFVVLDVEDGY